MEKTGQMYEKFLDEYVSEDAVRKYTTETAGYGVTYLLRNDYARIYLNVVDSYLRTSAARPLRLLEFGCGGGMNITRLISLLEEKQVPVECAYGTDFSPRLVQAAGGGSQGLSPTPSCGKAKLSCCPQRAAGARPSRGARQGRGSSRSLRPNRGC